MAEPQFYPLRIAEISPETDAAVCLRFDVPADLADRFRFTQGQYLTLKARIDDQDIRRSYSICSGVDEDRLEVAIKKTSPRRRRSVFPVLAG